MADTVGIVAIINGDLGKEILKLWDIADNKYKSKGVKSFDYSNLGFQGGVCENITLLKDRITEMSFSIQPFEIIVNGFGYFEQPNKVVYLKVVKTEVLIKVYELLNNVLNNNCIKTFELYSPQFWIPHITIAMDDLTDENYYKFKQELIGKHPNYKQIVSSFQLVKYCSNGRIELVNDWVCGCVK